MAGKTTQGCVLVTGAATGIGAATATYLHSRRYRVFGIGLEADGAAEALGLSFADSKIARIADPCEIATAIGFLISNEASFVTGSAMQVDGGMLARLLKCFAKGP